VRSYIINNKAEIDISKVHLLARVVAKMVVIGYQNASLLVESNALFICVKITLSAPRKTHLF